MARATPIINSLAGGEVSPHLDARQDIKWYQSSARLMRNALVRPQGGAWRRGGTRFIAEVKTSTDRTMLVRFINSSNDAYQLEFGDGYIRFFRNRGAIVTADIATAIANGTMTGGLTSWTDDDGGSGASAHDATNDRMSLASGGTTASDIAARTQTVTVAAGDQAKEHVLVFRVLGAAGDKVLLNVGTSSGGGQLVSDRECGVGWHAVAFTPGAGTIYVRFKNKGDQNNAFTNQNKTIQVDDVTFLDNQTLEITSPYAAADLFDSDNRRRIKITQSNDVLYLHHPDYPTYQLARSGHSTWALTLYPYEDGPYLDENTTPTTLTPGAGTGAGVTLTASAVRGINGGAGFATTDVGRVVRVKEGSTWGWGIIVGYTSTTVVTVDIRTTFTNTNAKSTWQLGLYSDTDGWPATGTFFEERFYLSGAGARPNRYDGSSSDDFGQFTPGTGDADAVAFTIASDQAEPIRWMAPAKKMIIGTGASCADMEPIMPGPGGEYAASGASSGAITPTSIEVKAQTRDVVLALDRFGRDVREISFTIEKDGYLSLSMTERAEHLMRGGLVDWAHARKPFGIVWAARADGLLLGFTYLRPQEVTAWHAHPLGGDGIVESVSAIPGTSGDEVWLIVKRTINGATKRYIEIMEDPLSDEEPDQDKAFYVDSGLTYDGAQSATLTPGTGATVKGTTGVTFTAGSSVFSSGDVGREIRYRVPADPDVYPSVAGIEARAVITGYTSGTEVAATITGAFPSTAAIASGAWRLSVTEISGLDHLEGESVQILADGGVHPAKTVASGAVTLDYPATYVQAGLQFTTKIKPVKLEAGVFEGTAQGKVGRVSGVTARLFRSLGYAVGPDESRLDRPTFRDATDITDRPPPLFTGDKPVVFRGQHDTSGDILFVQDKPLPFNLLGIMPTLAKAEGG